jgi:hypothetical protein
VITGLEGTRRESYGLDESKAITSEVYIPLASEPIGRWPTGRNRLVLYSTPNILISLNNNRSHAYPRNENHIGTYKKEEEKRSASASAARCDSSQLGNREATP